MICRLSVFQLPRRRLPAWPLPWPRRLLTGTSSSRARRPCPWTVLFSIMAPLFVVQQYFGVKASKKLRSCLTKGTKGLSAMAPRNNAKHKPKGANRCGVCSFPHLTLVQARIVRTDIYLGDPTPPRLPPSHAEQGVVWFFLLGSSRFPIERLKGQVAPQLAFGHAVDLPIRIHSTVHWWHQEVLTVVFVCWAGPNSTHNALAHTLRLILHSTPN